MKKFLLTLIMLSLFVSIIGCNSNSKLENNPKLSLNSNGETIKDVIDDTEEKPSIEREVPFPDHINLYIVTYRQNRKLSEEKVKQLEQYLYSEFELSIDIIYIYSDISDYHWLDMFEETEFDGIVYYDGLHHYKSLLERDLFIELSDYVSSNSFTHPSYVKAYSVLEELDGKIYSVPTFYRESVFRRSYQNQILEKYNLEVPESIDELSYMANILKDYGVYTIVSSKSSHSFFYEYQDIFAAFGVNFNSNEFSNISYNPHSGKYELPYLNENFIEALTYIKKMIDEKKFFLYDFTTQLENKEIASYVIRPSIESIPSYEEHTLSPYIKGEFDTHVVNVASNVGGFAILHNSYNVEGKLRFIYDQLFTNEQLMMTLNYGINGEDFHINNDHIMVQVSDKESEYSNQLNIEIEYLDISLPIRDSNKVYDDLGTPIISYYNSQLGNIREELDNNMFLDTNIYVKSEQLNKYSQELFQYTYKLYEDIFMNGISIDTAYTDFTNRMVNLGIQDYIDQLNDR